MEQQRLFKIAEERLKEFHDRAGLSLARLEDLFFRARRTAQAVKIGKPARDLMFFDDLRSAAAAVTSLCADCDGLPELFDLIERETRRGGDRETLLSQARSLLGAANRFQDAAADLAEQARMFEQSLPEEARTPDLATLTEGLSALGLKARGCPEAVSGKILGKLAEAGG